MFGGDRVQHHLPQGPNRGTAIKLRVPDEGMRVKGVLIGCSVSSSSGCAMAYGVDE
jgi:hypothetical protein